MSSDDIVFDEVTYREPQRVRRPDRDRRWACLAVDVPGPDDLPIFLNRKPADAIERHALRDTAVELGGILLGKECIDDQTGQPFVWITEALEAKHYENTQASFTYTHDSWQEITRERDRLHPDLDIVGWYHTHPDFGIFLSGHDLFIHQNFFDQALQVAYVVDPIRQARGFFQWRDGDLAPVGGFTLTAERHERVALSRLANDLENLPNTDGGGGLLSPRLEAALIELNTMLTRPYLTAPAERTQTAAVYSLLGLVVGALGLSLVLGLFTLTRQVQEQAEALKQLESGLKDRDEAARTDRDAARVEARAEALDSLLRDVRIGTSPESIVGRYEEVVRQRDEARRQLKLLATDKEALSDYDTKLKEENRKKAAELGDAKARNTELELERAERKDELAALKKKLAAQADLLAGTGVGALERKYHWAWYAAAAGILVSGVLGVSLFLVVVRGAAEDSDPVRPPPPVAGGESPHEIIT